MMNRNRSQDSYQKDNLDLDTELDETIDTTDTWGEKGGQTTRDQSNTVETEAETADLLDEEMEDTGSDF